LQVVLLLLGAAPHDGLDRPEVPAQLGGQRSRV